MELSSSMSLGSIYQVFQWCWDSRVPGEHPPGLTHVSPGSTHWFLWGAPPAVQHTTLVSPECVLDISSTAS